MDFVLAAASWPFTCAVLLLIGITLIEGLGLLAGMSFSGWLDHLIPEIAPDVAGLSDSWLGWLHVGRVPLLVLLVVLLTAFAAIGYLLNILALALLGRYLPALLSAPLAFIGALPVLRGCGATLARLIPMDESSAEPLAKLVGQVATIINGTARLNYPAQARVKNSHDQTLYIHVEPDHPEMQFVTGESILLVRQISGARFVGIRNPRPDLL